LIEHVIDLDTSFPKYIQLNEVIMYVTLALDFCVH
jgi:hypothetical protein